MLTFIVMLMLTLMLILALPAARSRGPPVQGGRKGASFRPKLKVVGAEPRSQDRCCPANDRTHDPPCDAQMTRR